MAELTPHLIEGLMSNIPPQQDFRRAVTIVSADPGSVVYQIEVPQDQCNYHGAIFGGFVNWHGHLCVRHEQCGHQLRHQLYPRRETAAADRKREHLAQRPHHHGVPRGY